MPFFNDHRDGQLRKITRRNIGMALSRTLLLVARRDSPLRRLDFPQYETIVRRVVERYVARVIGDARWILRALGAQHIERSRLSYY